MRIGFLLVGDLDRVSGGFLYDRLLVERLRALGNEVDVVSLPWRASRTRALAGNLRAFPRPLAGYDVVIEDELCHATVFARNARLRRAGVPVVALVHNLTRPHADAKGLAAAIERRYLRSVDGLVAVCESTLRDARLELLRDVPATVAPAGRDHLPASRPDAEAAATRAHAPGPLRVLVSAAVTPGKGLHRLLEALALVPAGSVVLDVAGALDTDPRYVRRVVGVIGRLGLASRVRLFGLLRGNALWSLYARSHVLALSSDREAYPLAAVEALGFGLPVVVTDRGGAREVVGDGPQARCLPPDDTAAWAAALRGWADDRATLARASGAALARHAALGTWDDVASRVLALCAQVRVRA